MEKGMDNAQALDKHLREIAEEVEKEAREKALEPIQAKIEPALPHIQVEEQMNERIYRVRDIETGDHLAMKLPDERTPKKKGKPFEMEARYQAQAASRGTHVAKVTKWNEKPHLILMPLYQESLEKERAMDLKKESYLFVQAAQALEETHRAGVIHCDMKPKNLVWNPGGDLALIDFGIARKSGREGEWAGTPYYVAPETTAQGINDERSDIYNLGCTLYHLVTREPPYLGADSKEVVKAHIDRPTPRTKILRPACPEKLDAAIYRAMQKDPKDRPQTATEFRTTLEDALR
jgi:serine/threonine-protein kinase